MSSFGELYEGTYMVRRSDSAWFAGASFVPFLLSYVFAPWVDATRGNVVYPSAMDGQQQMCMVKSSFLADGEPAPATHGEAFMCAFGRGREAFDLLQAYPDRRYGRAPNAVEVGFFMLVAAFLILAFVPTLTATVLLPRLLWILLMAPCYMWCADCMLEMIRSGPQMLPKHVNAVTLNSLISLYALAADRVSLRWCHDAGIVWSVLLQWRNYRAFPMSLCQSFDYTNRESLMRATRKNAVQRCALCLICIGAVWNGVH
jgi:hypothetical protein